MTESTHESLSALLDDEASELDLRRVLKGANNDGISAKMRRYQLQRSALHDTANTWLQTDISAAVSAAIADETRPAALPGWLRPVGGLAVAASVAAVMVVGSQLIAKDDPAATLVQNGAVTSTLLSAAPVSTAPLASARPLTPAVSAPVPRSVTAAAPATAEQLASDLQESRQRMRLQAYMRIHAQHASMNGTQGALPLARAANYRSF